MKFKNLRKMVKLKRNIMASIQTAIGAALIAGAVMFFLAPNQISTGGFSGLALIPFYYLGIPMGISVIVMNIPLFIVAYIKGGRKIFLNALFGTVILSALLNLFQMFPPLTEDRLLAAIYGGIMSGLGTAIIFKANASTRWYRSFS